MREEIGVIGTRVHMSTMQRVVEHAERKGNGPSVNVQDAPTSTKPFISTTIVNFPDAQLPQGRRTHDARFDGDV